MKIREVIKDLYYLCNLCNEVYSSDQICPMYCNDCLKKNGEDIQDYE